MEAARIDGANAWHQLWRIQLPNIWLVFSFVMFDCIRGTLQCFDIPFIMTNGGPGYASSTFTLYTIDTAFKYNSFGMAATMAVAIMAIVILVYVFQNVVLKKVFNGGGGVMNRDKCKRALFLCVKYLVSAAVVAVVVGPLLVTLFTSVKTQAQLASTSPILPPAPGAWNWDNYAEVLGAKLLPVAVKNTAVILVVSIFFNVLLGSVTAYCLQRFEFRFRRLVMGCFYLGMLVPTFVVEIARFKVIQSMGLYNTLGAPIIIYVASDLMQLYLYMQFVSKIPKALDESALIDGCGYFRIFYSIIFPLLAPATATVVILKIVNIVNDMYVPYLYMPKTKLKTLTTFLMNYAGAQQGSWPTLAAAIIVVLIPTVVLYLIFHKQITEGLSAGATKE